MNRRFLNTALIVCAVFLAASCDLLQKPPVDPPATFTVTLTQAAGGTVSVTPVQASYESGTAITVTAVPSSDFTFTKWSGDSEAAETSITVTVDKNLAFSPVFTAKIKYRTTKYIYSSGIPLAPKTEYTYIYPSASTGDCSERIQKSLIGNSSYSRQYIRDSQGRRLLYNTFSTTGGAKTYSSSQLYSYRGVTSDISKEENFSSNWNSYISYENIYDAAGLLKQYLSNDGVTNYYYENGRIVSEDYIYPGYPTEYGYYFYCDGPDNRISRIEFYDSPERTTLLSKWVDLYDDNGNRTRGAKFLYSAGVESLDYQTDYTYEAYTPAAEIFPSNISALEGIWSGIGKGYASDAANISFTMVNDNIILRMGTDSFGDLYGSVGTFVLDTSVTPNTFNLTNPAGETWLGIYKVTDGKLTLCINENSGGTRPTDFVTAGDGHLYENFTK